MLRALSGPTFDIRKTLPKPFLVAPRCVHTDEDLSDDALVRAFDKSEFSKISDEEMQRKLDDYELNVPRTVVGLKRAIMHGHRVHEKFFYDASAKSHYKIKERMSYIHRVFGSVDGARWWIENVGACGAPDDYCRTTGRLQEFYYFNDRQMVAFARTGYDASVGELPMTYANLIRIDDDGSY